MNFDLANNTLSFYQIPGYFPVLETEQLIAHDSSYSRYDQTSIVKINSDYILAVTRYDAGSGDFNAASILFYTSSDLMNWTYLSILTAPVGTVGLYQPSLYVNGSGDLVMLCQNKTSSVVPVTARLVKYVSSNNGTTWGAVNVVREVTGEYFSLASDRIFKTPTGRLIFPLSISDPVDIENCQGYTYYSDDDGATWSDTGYVIVSPDTYCAEQGFYQKDPSTIVCYYRNVSGVVYACESIDNGLTFGTISALPGLINGSSQSTIIKLNTGEFVALVNNLTNRQSLNIYRSVDGETFTNKATLLNSMTDGYIEPTVLHVDDNLFIYYSVQYVDNTIDLYVSKMNINTYLNSY